MKSPRPIILDCDRTDDPAKIKHQSVRGGAITVASQAASTGLQLISTIVMARILGPEEYGVMAMVAAVTGFAGLFRDLGLSSSTIQRDALSHEQLSTLYWINVGMGALLTAIVVAISPLVAWFYSRPELAAVTFLISFNFLLGSFGTQQGALLARQMRFGRRAVAMLSGSVVSLVLSVTLALHNFGYWSLAFAGLANSLVTTVMLNFMSGWRPGFLFRGSSVRSMIHYGAQITAFDFVNYFHRNLDNILIGRFWGAEALGVYSRAYQLLMFPIVNLRTPINSVAFPAMSRLQNQPEELRAYYRKVTALLAFISMPLTGFLFVGRKAIIELTLGTQWLGVVPIFAALAITGFIQPVVTLFGVVVTSAGLGQRYLKLGIFNTACVSLGFIVGVFFGPVGVAVGYGLATYLSAYHLLRWSFIGTGIRMRDFGEAILRPAIASLLAVVTGSFFSNTIAQSNLPPAYSIGSSVLAFFPVFLLVFALLPGGSNELHRMIGMSRAFLPAGFSSRNFRIRDKSRGA